MSGQPTKAQPRLAARKLRSLVRPKVRSCDECEHFAHNSGPTRHGRNGFHDWASCACGHTPRFIMPKTEYQVDPPWGWRRRCADFKARKAGEPIPFRPNDSGEGREIRAGRSV